MWAWHLSLKSENNWRPIKLEQNQHNKSDPVTTSFWINGGFWNVPLCEVHESGVASLPYCFLPFTEDYFMSASPCCMCQLRSFCAIFSDFPLLDVSFWMVVSTREYPVDCCPWYHQNLSCPLASFPPPAGLVDIIWQYQTLSWCFESWTLNHNSPYSFCLYLLKKD